MAEKTIRCRLITREARVLDAHVSYCAVPLWDGSSGFMAQAAPFVAKVGMGEFRVDMPGGGSKSWFIDGGFMQSVGNEITILTPSAIAVEELDREECRAELAEANAHKTNDVKVMDRITEDRRRARAKLTLAEQRAR